METPRDPFAIALDAREKGIVAVPCHPGMKVPMVKWKEWETSMPPLDLQREWFRDTRVNIGILTSGMVVFDCDDPEEAKLVIEKCGETLHKLKSPRGGIHLGYRRRSGVALTNRVKIKGLPIDVRTDGGLELIPNSETADGRYEWLGGGLHRVSELPVARIGWTRERSRRRLVTAAACEDTPDRLLFRGRRYVDTFERAVSGQGGHTTTFVSALKIVRFVHFDPGLAWALLCHYSQTRCDPPWSERELRHKLADALRLGR